MGRRERWSILADVLRAIADKTRESHDASIKSVTLRANLPYDRLMLYLDELRANGLVEGDRRLRLTEKGHEFLREYYAWRRVLQRFGMRLPEPHEAPPSWHEHDADSGLRYH